MWCVAETCFPQCFWVVQEVPSTPWLMQIMQLSPFILPHTDCCYRWYNYADCATVELYFWKMNAFLNFQSLNSELMCPFNNNIFLHMIFFFTSTCHAYLFLRFPLFAINFCRLWVVNSWLETESLVHNLVIELQIYAFSTFSIPIVKGYQCFMSWC